MKRMVRTMKTRTHKMRHRHTDEKKSGEKKERKKLRARTPPFLQSAPSTSKKKAEKNTKREEPIIANEGGIQTQ